MSVIVTHISYRIDDSILTYDFQLTLRSMEWRACSSASGILGGSFSKRGTVKKLRCIVWLALTSHGASRCSEDSNCLLQILPGFQDLRLSNSSEGSPETEAL